jgi:S-adenosylmethionine decarboxylase
MVDAHGPPPLVQRVADFRGVSVPALRDGAALAGLMLSAAGAAGLSTTESPIVRTLPRDGIAVLLFLDAGHMAVHTFPDRELVVLDLLVGAGRDPQKAVDVFARKFGVAEVRGAGARSMDRG